MEFQYFLSVLKNFKKSHTSFVNKNQYLNSFVPNENIVYNCVRTQLFSGTLLKNMQYSGGLLFLGTALEHNLVLEHYASSCCLAVSFLARHSLHISSAVSPIFFRCSFKEQ